MINAHFVRHGQTLIFWGSRDGDVIDHVTTDHSSLYMYTCIWLAISWKFEPTQYLAPRVSEMFWAYVSDADVALMNAVSVPAVKNPTSSLIRPSTGRVAVMSLADEMHWKSERRWKQKPPTDNGQWPVWGCVQATHWALRKRCCLSAHGCYTSTTSLRQLCMMWHTV